MDIDPSATTRRRLLAVGGATALSAALQDRLSLAEAAAQEAGVGGRIRHSACKWCYPSVSLEDLCVAGKEFGLEAIDLLGPDDFATVKKHGMHCPMVSNPAAEIEVGGAKRKVGSIPHGFNRREHHDTLVEIYEPLLRQCAEAGFTNVICFSGNRDGMDDEDGLEHCAEGLRRLLPTCERLGVTLTMELLNSKVNHKDYMCDRTEWGVALCDKLGSDRFKLLYDIYHMQIMEGDIIATIQKRHRYFSHYHTGGVPGRAEIDETQELNYPAIMRAIVETGYAGWVAQEFIPKREDKIASLRQAVGICTV
jgi:hydroxypyruvate isomerase